MLDKIHALSKTVTSNSFPTPQESKVVKNDKVIAPGMFSINPFKTSREEKHVPNNVRASARTKPITVSQPPVFTKKDVNSDSIGLSSTGVDNTKTRRPQPRSNTKNDRVPYTSKSSRSKNKGVKVEEHHRNLLLSKNNKHMSYACNNIKLYFHNVISKVVCAMCKQCLISVNHDVCLRNYVNGKTSSGKKQKANVSIKKKQKKHQPKIKKTKKVGFIERLATPKPRQLCDSNLEVAFRRNACFVRNLKGVDLLKGNRTTNLYIINLHDMASASPICLMARASSTESWLWHQRLSHLNFDTINDLAKNDLVSGLPKFKYHKEHLCPSCEQGKSKRASHPPKPVPNSRQMLQLLHMGLCGPMRIASINGKREQRLLDIIDFIYDDTTLKAPTASALQEKAIVCLKNNTADAVNVKILSTIKSTAKTYLSRDEAIQMGRETCKTELLYLMEYLNTITFPGFPPHELQLKVGSPIMLLRNVNLSGGLCNGTRMIF
nr:DNA helicase [Tanacetum cinerariifolium]